MARSLYICYFGVDQPLVQTQVIPYLRELVKGGHELTLLTFEPGDVNEDGVRESLAADGIEWHWLRYHRRPSVPATLFDIANGARYIRRLASGRSFDILHCRSHVPTMMAAIARKGMSPRPKLLFDIRGFFPEEYVDAGVWPEGGAIYRNVKRAEAWMMREADGYVVLTEAARNVIAPESLQTSRTAEGKPIEVIPCCVDFERRFAGDRDELRKSVRRDLGIGIRFALIHVGALGGLYLTDEMVKLLKVAREVDPSTFAIFLTQSDQQLITPRLIEAGFSESDFFVDRALASEVEGYICAADAGVSFVKASYSTISRSPTKVPEYLACGVMVIANAGVGDTDQLLQDDGTGVVLHDFDSDTMKVALRKVKETLKSDEDSRSRLRRSAIQRFDLEAVGGARYRRLYETLRNG